MRGLFFKVFVILWIAQSLIFVISTALIVRHHFDSPAVVFDALYSSLRNEAKESVTAYEADGCDAMRAYAGARTSIGDGRLSQASCPVMAMPCSRTAG